MVLQKLPLRWNLMVISVCFGKKKFKLKMCFLLLNVIAIFSQGGAEGPRGAGHKQTPIPTLSDLPNHGQVLYAFFKSRLHCWSIWLPFGFFRHIFLRSSSLYYLLPPPWDTWHALVPSTYSWNITNSWTGESSAFPQAFPKLKLGCWEHSESRASELKASERKSRQKPTTFGGIILFPAVCPWN